jgi:hypothetical protein
VQSHGVCGVWLGVLLAVQERDNRFALFESFWMHVLGHKAVVEEEEASMAVGDARWSTSHDCTSRRYRSASYDNR